MLTLQQMIVALCLMLSVIQITAGEELIEMTCSKNSDCEIFEQNHLKVNCTNKYCHCVHAHTKQRVSCRPQELLRTNIIGGNCPCNIPNAKCQNMHDLCYCELDHIPSEDKRRCLLEKVSLDGDCEMDKQCQALDYFTVCDPERRQCRCRDDYVPIEGRCASFYGKLPFCLNDTDCHNKTTNASCASTVERCVCNFGHVTNKAKDYCLPGKAYKESCYEDLQCQYIMGPGGVCKEFECDCSERYVVVETNIFPEKELSPMKKICEHLIEIGQYCRIDEDCHNGHLKDTYQPFDCKMAECGCKYGKRNASPCPLSASGAAKAAKEDWLRKMCSLLMLVSVAAKATMQTIF